MKIIIIGSGLAGSLLTYLLSDDFDVTLIETNESKLFNIYDAEYDLPHDDLIQFGLGGTTKLWHNGLKEINERIFLQYWPFGKNELKKYYSYAFKLLSGSDLDILDAIDIDSKFSNSNFFVDYIYYPYKRINAFHFLKDKNYSLVRSNAVKFISINDDISSLLVSRDNKFTEIFGDLFICCAGGLGSPRIFKNSFSKSISSNLIGTHYEDHPTGFIGEFNTLPINSFSKYIYILKKFKSGFLRFRYTCFVNNQEFSFQLRPLYQINTKFRSSFSNLRNNPFSIRNHLHFWTDLNSIFELISYFTNFVTFTKSYSVLLISSFDTSSSKIVIDSESILARHIVLDDIFFQNVEAAITNFTLEMNLVGTFKLNEQYRSMLHSSCHHSSTLRMASSNELGHVDKDCKSYSFNNLYVCDGSIIPASGSTNTGLTIAALSFRLAEFIKSLYK